MSILEIVLTLGLIIIDQLTKLIIVNSFGLGESLTVIDSFFKLTHVHNTGAAWSVLQGARFVFVIVALLVSLYLIYYLYKNKSLKKYQRFVIILIVSGAIGNMIDRVLHGYVIDFLDFNIFGYDFPVFNFADCCLTIGVILFAIDTLFINKEQ